MTDEERRWALADKLRRKGFIVAAYGLTKMQLEIERLAKELEEVKRHDMRDRYDALERGRENPI